MSTAPRLIANLGGEEGGGTGDLPPAAQCVAALWRALFDDPPYPWLRHEPGAAVAWWSGPEAAAEAAAAGCVLASPDPACVRTVHDKAFAHEAASRERLVPRALADCVTVLGPDLLRASDAVARVEAALGAWPQWARRRFTAKPRLGSSGRGRAAGEDGRVDAALAGAFARLAARGGAVLEPWLERTVDLSTQLHLAEDGGVTLLGSLTQLTTPAGVVLGHRGLIDSRGRVSSGTPWEEAAREAAALVSVAAAARGYFGPCGVDAFAFLAPAGGPDGATNEVEMLRPVVEFNARFTTGIVVLGHLRRHLAWIKRELGLVPGEHRAFLLRYDDEAARGRDAAPVSEGVTALPLAPPTDTTLWLARDPAALDGLAPRAD